MNWLVLKNQLQSPGMFPDEEIVLVWVNVQIVTVYASHWFPGSGIITY